MPEFKLHDVDSAPEEARPYLEESRRKLGFVPNFYAKLAESPQALEAYNVLGDLVDRTSLSPQEQQVAFLAVSASNGCRFCVAAHSLGAKRLAKVDPEVVAALREGRDVPDARLGALARFARVVAEKRGVVDDADLQAFYEAGYGNRQVFEVILVVTMKTLSNYSNHFGGDTPLNEELESEAWAPLKEGA